MKTCMGTGSQNVYKSKIIYLDKVLESSVKWSSFYAPMATMVNTVYKIQDTLWDSC